MATNAKGPAAQPASKAGWQSPYVNLFRLCGVETVGGAGSSSGGGAITGGPPPATAAPPPGVTLPPATRRQPQQAASDVAAKGTAAAAASVGAPAAPIRGSGGPPAHVGHERSGRVLERMDAQIGKRVLRITGTIPAVNYLRLPKTKSLGLTGRFCYLQIKLEPPALFNLHLDLATTDGNTARITVGNVLKDLDAASKRKAGTLYMAIPEASRRWTLVCIDLVAAAAGAGGAAFTSLKSVQLCSTMYIRGVFTSDIKFSLKSLPREMVMSHALGTEAFDAVWLPAEPLDVPEAPTLVKPSKRSGVRAVEAAVLSASRRPIPAAASDAALPKPQGEASAVASSSSPPPPKPPQPGPTVPRRRPGASAVVGSSPPAAVTLQQQPAAPRGSPPAAPSAVACPGQQQQQQQQQSPTLPEPYLSLKRVVGYSGERPGMLLWAPTTGEVVFGAGTLIVAQAAPGGGGGQQRLAARAQGSRAEAEDDTSAQWGRDGGVTGQEGVAEGPDTQRLFVGHTAHVACLSLGGEGRLLASSQEGKQPVVRLWDFATGDCLAILCAHADQLAALDVSPDGCAVLAVGRDSHARQAIAIWDTSRVMDGGLAPLLSRCVTDFNVRAAAFSPFEPDAFMTVGRDSMRCHRLKGGEIRAMSVRRTPGPAPLGTAPRPLPGTAAPGAAEGPNIFTALAFEAGRAAAQVGRRFAFVASAAGVVFQVDYPKRVVVAAYQAHGAAVNAIAVGEGVAVTAGDDGFLRVWPLDFRSYLLEAEHAAPVTAVALAPGGLRVAIGSEEGAVGVLDLAARTHATVLRSHCGEVTAVAVHPSRPEFATAAADGTARIWDAGGCHAQLYEFRVTGDGAATAAAYHPIRHELAVGYESGTVRVFDVATAALAADTRHHMGPVAGLVFSPEGARLATAGADGGVVVVDAAEGYSPLRVLPATDPTQQQTPVIAAAIAFSPDGAALVVSAPARRRRCCGSSAAGSARQRSSGSSTGPDGSGGQDTDRPAVTPDSHQQGCCLLVFPSDSPDPSVCIETNAPGFARLTFSPDGASLWGLTTTGEVLRFDAASGALTQRLRTPHRHGCTAIAMSPQGDVLFTGGPDGIIKAWAIGSSSLQYGAAAAKPPAAGLLPLLGAGAGEASMLVPFHGGARDQQRRRGPRPDPPVGVDEQQPPNQAFVGHPGVIKDIALMGDTLIAGGGGDSFTLWCIAQPPPLPLAAAVPAAERPLQGASKGQHPDLGVTMRSWLARSGGGDGCTTSTAEVAVGPFGVGSLVEQLAPLTIDPGVEPSPLFAAGAPGSPHPRPLPLEGGTTQSAPGAISEGRVSVVGFGATAARSVIWNESGGSLIYAADHLIIQEDLQTHRQRLLQHPNARPIAALALSSDGRLLASAAASSDSGAAEVCVWDIASQTLQHALQQHGTGVGLLAFSPDCTLLASAGAGTAGILVLWDLEAGEAVALGRAKGELRGLAWLPQQPEPRFLTAGDDGLLSWALQPKFLEQRVLTLPRDEQRCVAICTASAAGSRCTADKANTAFVADAGGSIWRVELADGRLLRGTRVDAMPSGEAVTVLQWAPATGTVAVGTDQGRVLRYGSDGAGGSTQEGPTKWQLSVQALLDGPVASLWLELSGGLCEGVAATTVCTAWYVDLPHAARAPVVCGHAGSIELLTAAPAGWGVSGSAAGQLVASAASDGVLRVWRLGEGTGSEEGPVSQAVPLVEFLSDAPCTAASFEGSHSAANGGSIHPEDQRQAEPAIGAMLPRLTAGYADGTIRAFDVVRRVILWAAKRHPSPVIALQWHPTQPLLLSASRDGSIAVTHTDTSRLIGFCADFTPAVTPLHALALSHGSASRCAAAWLDRFVVFEAPWGAVGRSGAAAATAAVLAEYSCPEVPDYIPQGAEARVAFLPSTPQRLAFISPCLGADALIYDVAARAPLRMLRLPSPALSLVPSPCGGLLGFGLSAGGVLLADSEVEGWATLEGPPRGVRAVAFTGDGAALAAAAGEAMWVWHRNALRSA